MKEVFMNLKRIFILLNVALLLIAPAGAALASPAARTAGHDASYATSSATTTYASWEPRPGDEKLLRGPVFLDLKASRLVVRSTEPFSVDLVLRGYLPTPCHQLRAVRGPTDTNRSIYFTVYSLVDPRLACISVLQPFSVTIPLGTFSAGRYTVYVNGVRLGEFSVGSSRAMTL